jgi:hypothetical protein
MADRHLVARYSRGRYTDTVCTRLLHELYNFVYYRRQERQVCRLGQ